MQQFATVCLGFDVEEGGLVWSVLVGFILAAAVDLATAKIHFNIEAHDITANAGHNIKKSENLNS